MRGCTLAAQELILAHRWAWFGHHSVFFKSIIEPKFKNWEISHKKVRVLACLIKQEDMLTLAAFPPGAVGWNGGRGGWPILHGLS